MNVRICLIYSLYDTPRFLPWLIYRVAKTMLDVFEGRSHWRVGAALINPAQQKYLRQQPCGVQLDAAGVAEKTRGCSGGRMGSQHPQGTPEQYYMGRGGGARSLDTPMTMYMEMLNSRPHVLLKIRSKLGVVLWSCASCSSLP